MNNILRLMRPGQWAKNGFVFLAIFFGGKLLDTTLWLPCILAFGCFCLCSSAVYAFNDAMDYQFDRLKPGNCKRPVASGNISRSTAFLLAASLAVASLISAYFTLGLFASAIIAAYLALNILYSLGLKKIPIVDVCVIALGFVLRLWIGGVVTNIPLSSWIVIMVFLLAVFLAVAKRRDEIVCSAQGGNDVFEVRQSARKYSLGYLDMLLGILAAIIMVAYILYTLQPTTILQFHTDKFYATSIFVMIGIFRYLQLTIIAENSGEPSKILFTDKVIIGVLACWILSFVIMLYV